MGFVKGDPRINRKGNTSKPKCKLAHLWKQALEHGDGPLAFFIKLKEEFPLKFLEAGFLLLPKEKEKNVVSGLAEVDLTTAAEMVLKHMVSKGDMNAVQFVLSNKKSNDNSVQVNIQE